MKPRTKLNSVAKLSKRTGPPHVALVHSIGYSDTPAPINPFIRKYIFPGADIPSLSEISAAAERTGLVVTDVEILRLHYAETLRHWRERFLAHWQDASRLYDERFCRMWEFYLALCEVGFRYRTSVVFQIQLTKRRDAVPITRGYMADWEQHAGPPGPGIRRSGTRASLSIGCHARSGTRYGRTPARRGR